MGTTKFTRVNQLVVPLMVVIISVFVSPRVAVAENLQGFAKGFIYPSISLTQNGTPLLQSFYFRFTNEDHHYGALGVEPNVPVINKATIGFSDKNGDDRYFYNITLAPYFGHIFRRTTIEFGKQGHGGGQITFPVQAPSDLSNWVFVIRGFELQYRGGDHHIQEIKIRENNGKVTVALNDNNDDDPFRVNLQYAYIPMSRFSEVGVKSGRNVKGGQRTSIPSGTGVIRGFDFNFKNGDHHIKEIGIMMNGAGRLEVFYSDKKPDDPFGWDVLYGLLNGGNNVHPRPPIAHPTTNKLVP